MPYADLQAWVAWNLVRAKGEPRKVPQRPDGGGNASVSDPATWGTLAAARRLADVRRLPGVGIVSAAVPDLLFFDFDRCIDPASGAPINDDALRLLEACQHSYSEITPSGAGCRIIGLASGITATISRKGTTPGCLALEIYHAAPRYLTVTGRRYGSHPDALADIGDVALDLLPLLGTPRNTETGTEARGDAELVRCILIGDGFHAELCALAARYIGRRMSATATAETLRGLMLAHPEATRDDRWQDRYDSIADLVASAVEKYAEGAEHRAALTRLAGRLCRSHYEEAEVRATILADAFVRGVEVEEAKEIAGWVIRRQAAAQQVTDA
jgi:hypothetical protein